MTNSGYRDNEKLKQSAGADIDYPAAMIVTVIYPALCSVAVPTVRAVGHCKRRVRQ